MRNFYRLVEGLDVVPIVHAVHARPDLWNRDHVRRAYKELAEADDILLRWPHGADVLAADNCPAMAELPQVRAVVFGLMRQIDGERLGRVLISRMAPGKRIYPHTDINDDPALSIVPYYKRYQVALQSLPGVVFRAGDEQVNMRTGDVWWFNNGVEHEVVNNSADDRLALVIDIRPCS